ncbi:hypothetical protein TNCV_2135541 [Trichonephila clavipes]|nr:hypothetical protein TNCV_2135541 [Trichonephila clavipes]
MQSSDERSPRRHVYGHQNTVHKTGTRLKRRHCAPLLYPILSFGEPELPFLSVAFSRKAEVMATLLTFHAAAIVIAPYEWILSVRKIYPVPD